MSFEAYSYLSSPHSYTQTLPRRYQPDTHVKHVVWSELHVLQPLVHASHTALFKVKPSLQVEHESGSEHVLHIDKQVYPLLIVPISELVLHESKWYRRSLNVLYGPTFHLLPTEMKAPLLALLNFIGVILLYVFVHDMPPLWFTQQVR